jgi:putative toxin-antitoxin system antitoxin component (TIGR02293 family)
MGKRDLILTLAAEVLGNNKLAKQWLDRPALGLDRRTPASLLGNYSDYLLVRNFLIRLAYGVYQ